MRLERTDPTRNLRRYYELRLTRSLFAEAASEGDARGGVALVRQWGRIGAPGGSRRIELFDDVSGARAAYRALLRAKARKGYRRVGQ